MVLDISSACTHRSITRRGTRTNGDFLASRNARALISLSEEKELENTVRLWKNFVYFSKTYFSPLLPGFIGAGHRLPLTGIGLIIFIKVHTSLPPSRQTSPFQPRSLLLKYPERIFNRSVPPAVLVKKRIVSFPGLLFCLCFFLCLNTISETFSNRVYTW